MSCYGGSSTQILPTGDVVPTDSVLVSYDDIRKTNSKLIELFYVKEENAKLREICVLDSAAISSLKTQVKVCNRKLKNRKRALNVLSVVSIAELILILFK
jgi:hypothetical protein